jgi:hypothetical protein
MANNRRGKHHEVFAGVPATGKIAGLELQARDGAERGVAQTSRRPECKFFTLSESR